MRQGSTENKSRRVKLVVIISVVLVLAVLISISLWAAHLRKLRTEMERNLTSATVSIELGLYTAALTDAEEALSLAQRLSDSEAIYEVNTYIWLIKAIILGDELFGIGDYHSALDVYFLANVYASNINNHKTELGDENLLDTSLIDENITITEMFIAFYMLIEKAESFSEASDFEDALATYKEALLVAAALSYTDGIEFSLSGVDEMQTRIEEVKRTEAMNLFAQGDRFYFDEQYTQAIKYFYRALEIYLELDDQQNIIMINARIDYAKRMLREKESQEPPSEDTQDSTQDDTQDDTVTQDERATNYEHNSSISFDMFTLIDNQNQRPANQIRMGTTDGMNEGWYNGCGWVAAYNTLILLGSPEHPADIVRYFETIGGTVFGGVFGTYPNTIEAYLGSLGYNVNHTLFPQLSMNIDEVIKASRVGIIAYVHTSAAHYATIEYREDINKFIVYNDSFARTRSIDLGFHNDSGPGAAIDSVAAFINYTPDILFSFSLITVQ